MLSFSNTKYKTKKYENNIAKNYIKIIFYITFSYIFFTNLFLFKSAEFNFFVNFILTDFLTLSSIFLYY